jgi:hypothetical protein
VTAARLPESVIEKGRDCEMEAAVCRHWVGIQMNGTSVDLSALARLQYGLVIPSVSGLGRGQGLHEWVKMANDSTGSSLAHEVAQNSEGWGQVVVGMRSPADTVGFHDKQAWEEDSDPRVYTRIHG